MNNDLYSALSSLEKKQPYHRRAWDYYEGRHPLIFSSAKLKQVFRRLDARFTLNWCSVVIDASADRINLKSIDVPGIPEADTLLSKRFQETELNLDSAEVHRSILTTGEAFVFLWRDSVRHPVEAYVHDADRCHVEYDPEHPKQKRFAAKWWHANSTQHLSLYYPDRIEHYVNHRGSGAGSWLLTDLSENPFGEVPVFHFRRDRARNSGELQSIYEIQDAVNKLLNDLMICSEFGVFAQRYIVSNAETGVLKNSPSEIWQIPAGDGAGEKTQVGQFEPMRLSNFLEPMAELASAIAIISRTPRHYFLRQGGDPSGESLLAMESPLIHKVSRIIDQVTPVWNDIGRFILKLEGIEVSRQEVAAKFEPPQGIPPKLKADIRQLSVNAGIPLETHLRREEGWTDEELQLLRPPNQAA